METILITVAVAAALAPLLLAWARGRSLPVKATAFVVWAIAVGGTGFVASSDRRQQKTPARLVTNRPVQVLTNGYVGSASCQACHPHEHDTWNDSYHRKMTRLATPESVLGDFNGVQVEQAGHRITLQRRGEQFWAEIAAPAGRKGDGPPRRVQRQIVMTTGSHNMQVYWYDSGANRKLGLLPFVYLLDDQRWVLGGATFLQPTGSYATAPVGNWNNNCIKCHVTHGQWRPRKNGIWATRAAEFGITCEACHGPGKLHVQANQDPIRRYQYHLSGEEDPTVANPGRMVKNLSSHVCGQCHGISEFADRRKLNHWREHGFPYRPGKDLHTTRYFIQRDGKPKPEMIEKLTKKPEYLDGTFWSDGMVRVSGREYNGLIETPCHQGGELSCLSCHTLHHEQDDPRTRKEWANDQLTVGMEGNQACTQCHQELEDQQSLTQHTYHQAGSEGSQCYNCHMPHTTYGLLKAIRSHKIDSPSVQTSLTTGRPNACNLCHLDKTLKWTAGHLSDRYGIDGPELTGDQDNIAASLLWLLKGDAGQRALVAWSMGWKPAQQVSGSTWLAPYLQDLLQDPYDAVRYIAYRSLRTLPGYQDLKYDYIGSSENREAEVAVAGEIWNGRDRADDKTFTPAMLLDKTGNLLEAEVQRLLEQRNQRALYLQE